jgi:monofunctional biosynthetic peptidoglycan transglycosylase
MGKKITTILLVYLPAGAVLASLLLVILLKWIPVTVTPLMLKRSIHSLGKNGLSVIYKWTPIEDISDEMIYSVIAAEDQRFYLHNGFDYKELSQMKQGHLFDGSPIRGCSTISQQTAKNCFTWCSKSWLRKGIEAYFTVLIEKIWGKERILEVYLNVAEMGPGIYGAEAAARRYFHMSASDLTIADASSLVCCLPNPLHRDPDWVNRYMSSRRAQIAYAAALSSFQSP